MAITFYDVLHRLQPNIVIGTASLKDNVIQHLYAIRKEVLYKILIELHNYYYALYRDRCLVILTELRVGTRAICLFWRYWD